MKNCFVESIKKAILCLLSFFMCINKVYIEKNKNDYEDCYRNKSVSEHKVVFSSGNYDVEYSLFGRNIKENLVSLHTAIHAHLHTTAYYTMINLIVYGTYISRNSSSSLRLVLAGIGFFLWSIDRIVYSFR